jgi:hypothetical protein
MQVEVSEDAKVYTLNEEHKNFTETGEIIKKDTILDGMAKAVKGKRRGQDFVYRVFVTDDNKFIHLNKVQPMKNVEVSIGADQGESKKMVDISPIIEENKGNAVRNALIGAVAGFLVAKYIMKKPPLMFVGIGIVGGVAIDMMSAKRKAGVVVKYKK